MKHFSTLTVITAIAMIISACGAKPVPTPNPVDIQNTAVAAASTMVAQTQAAIPTATLPPPTETPTQTPLATDTPVQLPTLNVAASPTTASASNNAGGDPCATRVLSGDLKGQPTTIRIVNTLKVPVTVSIYLNETAAHGECGYRSYSLSKGADVVIHDLVQGCYNLWAWSDAQGNKFNSSGYGCINNDDKWTFEVNTATVKFVGP
jgi:hypothetical protein